MVLFHGLLGTLAVFYTFCLAAAQGSAGIGPHLQDQLRIGKLPNVTWTIGRQYAGNLPVQRGTNLSLYFWGVETKQDSLTAPAGKSNAPWNIWLQGYVPSDSVLTASPPSFSKPDVLLAHSGPGSSSLVGLFHEVCANRSQPPLRFESNLDSPERTNSAECKLHRKRQPV